MQEVRAEEKTRHIEKVCLPCIDLSNASAIATNYCLHVYNLRLMFVDVIKARYSLMQCSALEKKLEDNMDGSWRGKRAFC